MNVQTILAFCVGSFYGCLLLLGMLWRFIRHPIQFTRQLFYRQKRDIMPPCLNDPNLGTHGFLHLEEVRLHYVVNGAEGKPLMLFVHGFPEFWYSWRYQLKEFSKDYRVVAIDMRGYGDSDKPVGVENYQMEKLSADIRQLIPALGYSSCVLVAHDWGGAVAWNFATFNQEMVNKLIILNCPHAGVFQKYMQTNWQQFKKSWYMFLFQMPFLPELMFSMNDYNSLKEVFVGAKGGVKSDKTTMDDIEAYKYAASRPGGITGPINYYRAAFRRGKVRKMGKIEKPVLVIWGKPDAALSEELAALSGEYCTDFRVKYIENASHWVQMDRPEEVNACIREFLK